MKKNVYLKRQIHQICLSKFFKVMKLTTLLLLLGIVQVAATNTYSQKVKLSLSFHQASVREVFNEIEQQSEFTFFYNNELLNDSRKVDVDVKNALISDILDIILENTKLGYVIIDRLIVITPKSELNRKQQFKKPDQVMVKGKVTDESGVGLPGVNVLLKGTSTGTITSADGNYQLEVPSLDGTLIFSFIGFEKKEVPINGRDKINVSLKEDITEIGEVVKIGYGVQKKTDVTGAISVVKTEDAIKVNPTSIDKALQGRAAGVQITNISGKPGEGATVKIRGIGSISAGTEPLYVIDGVPVSDNALNMINPADIESIQVLKDASASAIYGARGANGVIIIDTKKGQSDKIRVNFNSYYGISQMAHKYDVLNADQYSQLMEATWGNYAERENITDDKNLYLTVYSKEARAQNDNLDTDTDFFDELFRQGQVQSYNLSLSKGTENSNLYFSASYLSEEGILIDTDMDRFNLRVNSDFNISDRITIGESLLVGRVDVNDESHLRTTGGPLTSSPLMPLYDNSKPHGWGGPVDSLTGGNERTNPVAEQMLNDHDWLEHRILASTYMEIELLKGLTYKLQLGANYKSNNTTQWSPEYELGNTHIRDNDLSKLQRSSSEDLEILLKNVLTYEESFGSHNITLMGAFERFAGDYEYFGAVGTEFPYQNLNVLDQATETTNLYGGLTEHNLESYLGRVMYDYKGKYLLTASIRRDGSSRFGPKNRYGNFPSVSLGWKINEDFLRMVPEIDLLKLRLSWGQTGNENFRDYWYFNLMDPLTNSRYTFGENQSLWLGGATTSFQANPLIKWEAAEMYNIGLDLNAFANKVQFSAEYFIKNQNDMLVQVPISVVFGKRVNYGTGLETVGSWVNLGKVKNSGLELFLTYQNKQNAFNYSVTGNFSMVKNEVIKLAGRDVITNYTITTPGNSIGSFYGYVAERILQEDDFDEEGNYKYALQEKGTAPGDIKFKDLNRDGKITDDDRTIIGKPFPDFTYGLNFDLGYKGFDFTLFLQGMQNFQIFHSNMRNAGIATDRHGKDENKLVETLDYWTPENQSTTMTRADVVDPNINSRISSWFLEDGSFIRVKNLQFGYSIPPKLLSNVGISQFRLYINTVNLYTLTKYKGLDPEVGNKNPLNSGVDNRNYPMPRQITFGLQINF